MKIKILSLTLIVLFAISAAWAQKPGNEQRKHEQRDRMKRYEQFAKCAGDFFTDEQKEQIKTIRLETAQKVKPLRNELNELEAHQQTLTTANDVDMKAINKNIDKISDVKGDIAKIMAKQHQDIRALLTNEQKVKFDMMKNHMRDHGNTHFRNRRPSRRNVG